MKFENWNPESDILLKPGERELHQHLHSMRSEQSLIPENILQNKSQRRKSLDFALSRVGGPGRRILEVGAGDGWCSSYLLHEYSPEEVYIMEIDEAAVHTLIPKMLAAFEVSTDNVTMVLGSFNHIPKVNFFDTVIAMGALHHSSNLYATMVSIFESLRPGGMLFSQEPAMSDATPNQFFIDRESETTTFEDGFEFKNADRSDVFYRKCEFLTAAYHAGFEVHLDIIPRAGHLDIDPEKTTDRPFNIFLGCRKPSDVNHHLSPTKWENNEDDR